MIKIISAEQMREIDRLSTAEYGIPSILLMENAARSIADAIRERFDGDIAGKNVLILCGKGNNGGDGAAVGRILASYGAFVDILLFGNVSDTKGDARINFDIFTGRSEKEGNRFTSSYGDLREINSLEDKDDFVYNSPQDWDVMIDAIFGTGLTRPVEGYIAQAIRHFNSLNEVQKNAFGRERLVVSIDIPSGLNADSGELLGEAFEADLTVTFTAPKAANVLSSASRNNGMLVIADIGSPQKLIDTQDGDLYLAEDDDAADWLADSSYSAGSYKNKRGHALVIAGSEKYAGAAVLSANAAMVTGSGLVTLAAPKAAMPLISPRLMAEVMATGVGTADNGTFDAEAFVELEELMRSSAAVAIGCGIGRNKETAKFVRDVISARRQPIVIDADALDLLSPFDLDAGSNESPLILTPHEGEFKRLLGSSGTTQLEDRVNAARDFAKSRNIILVLKGERTLIAEPKGRVVVIPTGNPGLGKAGNGDTLAGIITGFLAQAFSLFDGEIDNRDPFELAFDTVIAAVYIAGIAGDIAYEKLGARAMNASDVRDSLVDAFAYFEGGRTWQES